MQQVVAPFQHTYKGRMSFFTQTRPYTTHTCQGCTSGIGVRPFKTQSLPCFQALMQGGLWVHRGVIVLVAFPHTHSNKDVWHYTCTNTQDSQSKPVTPITIPFALSFVCTKAHKQALMHESKKEHKNSFHNSLPYLEIIFATCTPGYTTHLEGQDQQFVERVVAIEHKGELCIMIRE